MICVSDDNNLYYCSSMIVAEQFQEHIFQSSGSRLSISEIENACPKLAYDLGGVVFISDTPHQIQLSSEIIFEFRAQHWSALKFDIKQALKTNSPFVILDGRWIGIILSRSEAELIWAELQRNNDKYVSLEAEILDRHARAIESLRSSSVYAERKMQATDVQ